MAAAYAYRLNTLDFNGILFPVYWQISTKFVRNQELYAGFETTMSI